MMEYKFKVMGRPVPCGRPVVTKRGTFTPKKSVDYQKLVHGSFMQKYGIIKVEGDLSVYIDLYFQKKPMGDIDNYAKNILDGLRAYFNDRNVVSLMCHKLHNKMLPEMANVVIKQIEVG